MMADFASLQEEIDRSLAYARQAREYTRMARDRAILTRQEIRRAYRRTLMAALAPAMPTANAWTREITASILVRHGLLHEQPALRSLLVVTTGAPPRRPRRRKAGRDDDGRVS